MPLSPFAPAQLPRLLVIAARPEFALSTQRALLIAGHQVEAAATLRRGLAIVRHRPPDGIVLDSELRQRHGPAYEALVAEAEGAGLAVFELAEAPLLELAR